VLPIQASDCPPEQNPLAANLHQSRRDGPVGMGVERGVLSQPAGAAVVMVLLVPGQVGADAGGGIVAQGRLPLNGAASDRR